MRKNGVSDECCLYELLVSKLLTSGTEWLMENIGPPFLTLTPLVTHKLLVGNLKNILLRGMKLKTYGNR